MLQIFHHSKSVNVHCKPHLYPIHTQQFIHSLHKCSLNTNRVPGTAGTEAKETETPPYTPSCIEETGTWEPERKQGDTSLDKIVTDGRGEEGCKSIVPERRRRRFSPPEGAVTVGLPEQGAGPRDLKVLAHKWLGGEKVPVYTRHFCMQYIVYLPFSASTPSFSDPGHTPGKD